MCPSLIEIGSKTAEKNSAQTNKQTNKQTDKQTLRKQWSLGREPITSSSLRVRRFATCVCVSVFCLSVRSRI